MIYLDAMWGLRRSARINGKNHWIPFGVDLSSNLVSFINDWITNSGQEWSAHRMRELTQWAIHVLAGNLNYRAPWFKTIRYKGYMIPRLDLFKLLIDRRSDPNLVRMVMTVLKSYRLRTWGRPTLASITDVKRSPDPTHYVNHLRRYVSLPRVPKSVLGTVECVNTLKSYCNDYGATRPGPYGLKDDDFPAEIRLLYQQENEEPMCLGKLCAIPDKGKWRVILVGHWAIQLKTKKLADWLRSWLWTLPEIASGAQEKMSTFIISSLEKKRYMLSIDLSQATDRLSVEIQKKLLISMGVPEPYFNFLRLPAFYREGDFFEKGGNKLKKVRYANGQPMGLFLSFPMFELLHYVILKWVTATTDADFSICGDDVIIACEEKDSTNLFTRYKTLIERFGGEISKPKTVQSARFAEGVGAIYLKGYPKELRIPSGRLSILEASSPGFWLSRQIKDETPIGRAIHAAWLNTQETKEYTYSHRRALNEKLILKDLDDWRLDSLRALATHENYPQIWYSWEEAPPGVGMSNPLFPEEAEIPNTDWTKKDLGPDEHFKWISKGKYRDLVVSHKVISLYKKENKEDSQ